MCPDFAPYGIIRTAYRYVYVFVSLNQIFVYYCMQLHKHSICIRLYGHCTDGKESNRNRIEWNRNFRNRIESNRMVNFRNRTALNIIKVLENLSYDGKKLIYFV